MIEHFVASELEQARKELALVRKQRDELLAVVESVISWDDDKPLYYVAFNEIRNKAVAAIQNAEAPRG